MAPQFKPLRCFPALLAALLLAAIPAAAATIRIDVRDPAGAPLAATVRLEHLASGRVLRLTGSETGRFEAAAVDSGRYRVEASHPGFTTQSFFIDLVPGTNSEARVITLAIGGGAFAVDVAATTPLPGSTLPLDQIPAPVQTADKRSIAASASLDISDFLNRRLTGVYWNELQGNPVQPDLNYRGYTASPLLGTPQGISVYLDGVRLNQPFGDVMSWDLIPLVAVSELALIPGSNPLFGLNTLGGAVALQTKDGGAHPGSSLYAGGGSFGRLVSEFEHGGADNARGWHWYLAGNLFFEDGWRQSSPSNVRQFLTKVGRHFRRTSLAFTAAYANNALIGNGLQEFRFLNRDYSSIYTKPDLTANRSPMLNLSARHVESSTISFAANAYFRHIRTRTLNGDLNEESLDQNVYQPNAAERAALAAAGYSGFPIAGESAANTPFPSWRCIANALLRDEPSEKCNGLLNRTASGQQHYGLSGQVTWLIRPSATARVRHQLTAGAALDRASSSFRQSSELGYLTAARDVSGVGAFGDGVTGGEADGEPYDTRVDLAGAVQTAGLYVADTMTFGPAAAVTLAGRFNRTSIDNRDGIRPQAGPGSLTGRHQFNRLNPAAGITFRPWRGAPLNAYLSYTEGSRAPTSIELGCADPETPCRLPNALAGDPPLAQVTTSTWEGGLRSSVEDPRRLRWSVGWFRATNRDDILFVASRQTGFGYFRNFGRTLRHGAEFSAASRLGRFTFGGGYTLLDATFQSAEEVNGSGNSTNEAALGGMPGAESAIVIQPGNRIPLTPRHVVKSYLDVQVTERLGVNSGLVGASSSYARGNENNQHRPDGTYYLGEGTSPGYVVLNVAGYFQLSRRIELRAQVHNVLDRRYFTAAQLGPAGFTESGAFAARPLPPVNGEFPVVQSTFLAPGAPRGFWVGLRWRF